MHRCLRECTSVIGLEQHVEEYTHKKGHTLDHIYTQVGCEATACRCRTNVFISDQCLVVADFTIQRGNIEMYKQMQDCGF